MKELDFSARHDNNLVLLKPMSEAARDWVADHLPEDCLMFGNHFVIEARYWPPIHSGILNDGLMI